MLSRSDEKRLLPSCPFVHLSVRPSACISATPTGRISVKFDICDVNENVLEIPYLIKMEHFT